MIQQDSRTLFFKAIWGIQVYIVHIESLQSFFQNSEHTMNYHLSIYKHTAKYKLQADVI